MLKRSAAGVYKALIAVCLACFIVMSLFAGIMASVHLHHDKCTGEQCGTCMVIACIARILKQLGFVSVMAAVSAAIWTVLSPAIREYFFFLPTPIFLKVRLNN